MSCGDSFFGQARASKKCPKNMPAKFEDRATFVPGVFFSKEGHSTMMDRHSAFLLKSFLSRPP